MLFAKAFLMQVPEYFWEVPASSTIKHGENDFGKTEFLHPVITAKHVMSFGICNIEQWQRKLIADLVLTYMGQLVNGTHGEKEVLDKSVTETQRFVNMCDYLSCQINLEFKFDEKV
jgi:hypothetical protein